MGKHHRTIILENPGNVLNSTFLGLQTGQTMMFLCPFKGLKLKEFPVTDALRLQWGIIRGIINVAKVMEKSYFGEKIIQVGMTNLQNVGLFPFINSEGASYSPQASLEPTWFNHCHLPKNMISDPWFYGCRHSIVDHFSWPKINDINSQKWTGDLCNYYCILSIGVHPIRSRHEFFQRWFGGEKPQCLSIRSEASWSSGQIARLLVKTLYSLLVQFTNCRTLKIDENAFQIRIWSLKLTSLLPKMASFLVRIISLSAQNHPHETVNARETLLVAPWLPISLGIFGYLKIPLDTYSS